jgi:hypothetical protein
MADPAFPSSSPSPSRRELVRAYKDAFPPMGVYAVRNRASGRVLVGASRNVDTALQRLRFELRMRGCRNVALMRDWIEQGADAFEFEVLERVRPREEPGFDADAELEGLLEAWRFELASTGAASYNSASGGLA